MDKNGFQKRILENSAIKVEYVLLGFGMGVPDWFFGCLKKAAFRPLY